MRIAVDLCKLESLLTFATGSDGAITIPDEAAAVRLDCYKCSCVS